MGDLATQNLLQGQESDVAVKGAIFTRDTRGINFIFSTQ